MCSASGDQLRVIAISCTFLTARLCLAAASQNAPLLVFTTCSEDSVAARVGAEAVHAS